MGNSNNNIDYKAYYDKGISYAAYNANFEADLNTDESVWYVKYLPQNWKRQNRLDRKLKLNEALLASAASIKDHTRWLVISEHWCGDASQINPIFNKIAEASKGKIDLRFVYRDTNHELIDAHLTDGKSRSIPILIVLDDDYRVVDTYGPRPEEAQKLVKEILAKGESYAIPVHTWYAKDKQKSLQAELLQMLNLLTRKKVA